MDRPAAERRPPGTRGERVIDRRRGRASIASIAGGIQAARRTVAIVLLMILIVTTPGHAAAAVVRSGPASTRAVALTFDDGIGRAACARITKTLRAFGAKGTFFINAVNLRRAPARWRRILKGMPVGNHTASHPDLVRLSDGSIRRQIQGNEAAHERILGRRMLKMLRPPYGSTDARVRRIAASLGYRRIVLWSVDPEDWRSSVTPAAIVKRSIGAPPGAIILLHCSRRATAEALPRIIRHYRARGIRLAGLGTVLRRRS